MKAKRQKYTLADAVKKVVLEPDVMGSTTYPELVTALGDLMAQARAKVARTVNQTLVTTYWQMGRYIVEYEQNGADRAKYGAEILTRLSHDLTIRCGRGFGKSNLVYMRKLYRAFPKGMTASYKLTWSHYLEILKSNDELEIGFYCAECVRSNWDVRELRRELAIAFEEEPRRLARAKRKGGMR